MSSSATGNKKKGGGSAAPAAPPVDLSMKALALASRNALQNKKRKAEMGDEKDTGDDDDDVVPDFSMMALARIAAGKKKKNKVDEVPSDDQDDEEDAMLDNEDSDDNQAASDAEAPAAAKQVRQATELSSSSSDTNDDPSIVEPTTTTSPPHPPRPPPAYDDRNLLMVIPNAIPDDMHMDDDIISHINNVCRTTSTSTSSTTLVFSPIPPTVDDNGHAFVMMVFRMKQQTGGKGIITFTINHSNLTHTMENITPGTVIIYRESEVNVSQGQDYDIQHLSVWAAYVDAPETLLVMYKDRITCQLPVAYVLTHLTTSTLEQTIQQRHAWGFKFILHMIKDIGDKYPMDQVLACGKLLSGQYDVSKDAELNLGNVALYLDTLVTVFGVSHAVAFRLLASYEFIRVRTPQVPPTQELSSPLTPDYSVLFCDSPEDLKKMRRLCALLDAPYIPFKAFILVNGYWGDWDSMDDFPVCAVAVSMGSRDNVLFARSLAHAGDYDLLEPCPSLSQCLEKPWQPVAPDTIVHFTPGEPTNQGAEVGSVYDDDEREKFTSTIDAKSLDTHSVSFDLLLAPSPESTIGDFIDDSVFSPKFLFPHSATYLPGANNRDGQQEISKCFHRGMVQQAETSHTTTATRLATWFPTKRTGPKKRKTRRDQGDCDVLFDEVEAKEAKKRWEELGVLDLCLQRAIALARDSTRRIHGAFTFVEEDRHGEIRGGQCDIVVVRGIFHAP